MLRISLAGVGVFRFAAPTVSLQEEVEDPAGDCSATARGRTWRYRVVPRTLPRVPSAIRATGGGLVLHFDAVPGVDRYGASGLLGLARQVPIQPVQAGGELRQLIAGEHPEVAHAGAISSERFARCVVWTANYIEAGYEPGTLYEYVAPEGLSRGFRVGPVNYEFDWNTLVIEAPSAETDRGEVV